MYELHVPATDADATKTLLSPADIYIISPDAESVTAQYATAQFEAVKRQVRNGLKVAKRPALTPAIAERLRVASPQSPVVIPSEPFQGAIPQMCFRNAQLIADLHGGSVMTGWSVWEERSFLTLEYHGVWIQAGRGLVCVTPTLMGEKSILFLPDEEYESIPPGWIPDPAKHGFWFPLANDDRVIRACQLMSAASVHHREGSFEFRRMFSEAFRLLDAYERTLANRERRQKEKATRKRRRRGK